ncbi:hypothetical protein BJX99DRAFT_225733 [Aspergillus californicus]
MSPIFTLFCLSFRQTSTEAMYQPKVLSLLYVLLGLLAPHVLASKLAGRYQAVYMWYAYRMDIQAYGARNEMIAPNCFGTVPDGTCYFDEFIDYLQRDGKKLDAGQATSIGKYFWPDAVTAAEELKKLTIDGAEFVPNQDPKKIFLKGTFTVDNPRNSDILGLVTDKIQEARVGLGDEVLSEGVAESRVAMTAAHEARIAENSAEMIDTVNDYLASERGSSLTVETKPVTGVDGSTYTDIDIGKTVAKDSSFSGYWGDFQQWLAVQKRTSATALGRTKMHWDAIQGVQQIEARVHGADTC